LLRRPRAERLAVVGVDTGGTFTDLVVLVGGRIRVAKLRSTPDDPARAVRDGLRALALAPRTASLHYGTTVATNALLERRGARGGSASRSGCSPTAGSSGRSAAAPSHAW